MTGPAITFLTTSGATIGLGHLRRCLTLAEELVARGAKVGFALTGDESGVAIARQAGFQAVHLDTATASEAFARTRHGVVVVDDYAVDGLALATLRGSSTTLAILDDLGDRALDVDLVVNPSPAASALPYRLPEDSLRLFGADHALLAPAFRGLTAHPIADRVERVLVTLGGADPNGQTPGVVRTVRAELPSALIDVVIGPLFDERSVPDEPGCTLHRAPAAGLSPLMLSADLAVTGGGQTTYELAACGLPTVALCLADNQRENLTHLAAAGTLTWASNEGPALARLVNQLAGDVDQRRQMSAAGQRLVDGFGAARVATTLLSLAKRRARAHA